MRATCGSPICLRLELLAGQTRVQALVASQQRFRKEAHSYASLIHTRQSAFSKVCDSEDSPSNINSSLNSTPTFFHSYIPCYLCATPALHIRQRSCRVSRMLVHLRMRSPQSTNHFRKSDENVLRKAARILGLEQDTCRCKRPGARYATRNEHAATLRLRTCIKSCFANLDRTGDPAKSRSQGKEYSIS